MKKIILKTGMMIMCLMFALSGVSCREGRTTDLKSGGGNWKSRPAVTFSDTVTLDKNVIRDKILGMWVGSAIGLGSGYEYVTTTSNPGNPIDAEVVPNTVAYVAMADKYWEPNGVLCSGSIGVNALRTGPVNDPRVSYNKVISDDDMHVDVLNQFIFRDYGPDLGAQDIAEAWSKYAVSDVGGGESVTASVKNNGYMPPYTGQRMYGNAGYWVTEPWIENETLGSIFPYMPRSAEAYAELFTATQGDALAMYLGKLCSLMTVYAYEYSDARTVIEKAFERLDKNNEIYEMYKYVLGCYTDGVDWRGACVGAVERRINCKLISVRDAAGFSINANAAMIFIGLLYGENDFERSIKITSLCGLDGDCTACTVGGLVGQMTGFEALPEKYKDYINGSTLYYNYTGKNVEEVDVYWGAFAYCGANFPNSLSFDEITDLTLSNLEAQIMARGGEVDGNEYIIRVQTAEPIPQVAVTNRSFERGDTYGWQFEGGEGTDFSATLDRVHLGNYAGMITTESTDTSARAYQNVSLKIGNRYRVTAWMLGCNDREVRLFAGNKYRSYINPITSNSAFVKLELYFTAESAREAIGIELCAKYGAFSYILNFDDFAVEDVTHLTDGYYQAFSARDYHVSENVTLNGNDIVLGCTDGLRFEYEGMRGYQTFKIYYGNRTGSVAQASLYIDGKNVGSVPLPTQGENADHNEGNCAIVYLYSGTGKHTFKMVLNSFEDITVERIEVYGGNTVFSK